ncbi:MAG: NAD(P)/FAD-dependent oxidoreductase, partial [Rectinemataceae bacterium]
MSDPISRYQAIVIGGGPAGLFAAIRLAQALAAESQARASPSRTGGVLLLERKGKPGRKLLLSGSGQCNITHAGEMADFLARYGGGAKP